MEEIHLVPVVQRPLVRVPLISSLGFSTGLREAVRNMTRPQKVVILSVGTGLALVALVARYLRRRKRRTPRKSALHNPDDPRGHRKVKPITIRSPSGEIHSVGGNVSPGFHRSVHHRHSSISSDRTSVASTLGPQGGNGNPLTPQQYGVMDPFLSFLLPSKGSERRDEWK
ncbi:uncharacterized protein LOC126981276 [Eriocheir sinensis]|uniref:uncharacterized protein LOC126981276 n=1 Tax=Eriocheir sinensis TaxID=95602 RepID=UPI0021C9C97A|nr:uncharacterized protein LOC126981276 [Eriocheir sinensis]